MADQAEAQEIERTTSGTWMRIAMFLGACTTVGIMLFMVWTSELGEFAQGVVTLILGRFLGYIDSMYGFEFSTTRASARKDETIKDLASKSAAPRVISRSTDPHAVANAEIVADTVNLRAATASKVCSNCSTPNPPDALFCRNCGTKLG